MAEDRRNIVQQQQNRQQQQESQQRRHEKHARLGLQWWRAVGHRTDYGRPYIVIGTHDRNKNLVEEVGERICGRNLERDLFHRTTIQSADWAISSPSPRPGDAIARSITVLIWHHGIYLGNGRVCHRTANSPPVEVSMDVFLAGWTTFQVIVYSRDSEEARADSVKIARMALRNKGFQKNNKYDLLENNCEHFSTFCRTGERKSSQAAVGAAAVAVVGAVIPGRVFNGLRHGTVLRSVGSVDSSPPS